MEYCQIETLHREIYGSFIDCQLLYIVGGHCLHFGMFSRGIWSVILDIVYWNTLKYLHSTKNYSTIEILIIIILRKKREVHVKRVT